MTGSTGLTRALTPSQGKQADNNLEQYCHSKSSANLNGDKDSVRVLVKDDIEEPRAIVLHPGKG